MYTWKHFEIRFTPDDDDDVGLSNCCSLRSGVFGCNGGSGLGTKVRLEPW